jgi:hypothetical protein
MILQIHDNLHVSDVQERFSKCFPYLKIEFYRRAHHIGAETLQEFMVDANKRIGEIRRNTNAGCMEIKSWFTVSRIEKDFKELFGLNVQVFRNENNEWIQTSKTDNRSLLQQTEMARYAERSTSPKCSRQLAEYEYL